MVEFGRYNRVLYYTQGSSLPKSTPCVFFFCFCSVRKSTAMRVVKALMPCFEHPARLLRVFCSLFHSHNLKQVRYTFWSDNCL